jgi:hypothetical protein
VRPLREARVRRRRAARALRQVLRRVHRRYIFERQLRLLTWLRHGRRHSAPIDPISNIVVDPATIGSWIDMDREEYMRIRFVPDVRGGDWDLDTKPFSEHFVFRSIDARFNRGVPWDETELTAVALAGIRSGEWLYHGCRSPADIAERQQKLDRIYERIRRDGYKPQRDLHMKERGRPPGRSRSRPPELDEVVVSIGRNGDLILIDGIHRFSMARLLCVPAIPVWVLVRHADWQAHRDGVARNPATFPASTFDHPDLAALRPARRRAISRR